MNRYLAVALAPLSWLPAQDAPPQFVPKSVPIARMRVEGIVALRAVWPQTGIGRLFADPDVAAMVAKYSAWADQEAARRMATFEAASRLELELKPDEAMNIFSMSNSLVELNVPFAQMRRLESFAISKEVAGLQRPSTTTAVSCLPQFEGRCTHAFERDAATFRSASWCVEQEGVKVGAFDAYRFTPPAQAMAELGERGKGLGRWMMHLPGTFVAGVGLPEEIGTVEMSPKKVDPGMFMSLSIPGYLEQLELGDFLPATLGFEALKNVQWRSQFVGENIVEDLELELAAGVKPTGVVAALLAGGGKLVPQALPKGALAQLRFAVGYESLMAAVEEIAGDELEISEELKADVVKMLDGSVAIGTCAPKGGMIPQVFLTLGLADAEAFDRVVAAAIAMGFPVKNVSYGGAECTLLKFPDMPAGIQPGFCRVGNVLHIAESGLSLRALLKAQENGVEAMDVGDATLASVPGDVVPTVEARFDLPLIYRNFYQKWLPLFEMTASGDRPITRNDMPDPDVVDELVSAVRGVAFRDGNHYVLRHTGTVGPMLALYLMAWSPMASGGMGSSSSDLITRVIGSHKMRAAWDALQAFEAREGRLPRDLAELFVAEKLAGDALLMPMDELAETIALPGGKQVQSSFRYFPEGVDATTINTANDALMIEILPRTFGRAVLTNDGNVRVLYSAASLRDIDEFGK